MHLNFARGYLSIDEPKLALPELDAALGLRPFLVGAHHTKGHALAMLGHSAEALRSLTAALELSPGGDPEIADQKRKLEADMVRRGMALPPASSESTNSKEKKKRTTMTTTTKKKKKKKNGQ